MYPAGFVPFSDAATNQGAIWRLVKPRPYIAGNHSNTRFYFTTCFWLGHIGFDIT